MNQGKKGVLFLSYDGMTDPLGQSQVIPYLVGLSKAGYPIHLISFEKKKRFEDGKSVIEDLLNKANIAWYPSYYTKKPPILSTIMDVNTMKKMAGKIIKEHNIGLIHCRSAIAGSVGLWAKENFSCRMIYDMRGFYADERVDGKIWNLNNPFYLAVYKYFKKKELAYIREADYTVSLTENGKQEILSWESLKFKAPLIKVIPCCADLEHFSPKNINSEEAKRWREKLGIQPHEFVLVYLGSLGTWYMVKEMLHYFSRVLLVKPNAKFLIISTDDEKLITQHLSEFSIPDKQIILTPAKRNQVPNLLSIADFSLFFILPVYSKKASSPTKLAELMALAVPVVCNAGVGDVDQIVRKANAGIVLDELNSPAYDDVVQQMLNFHKEPEKLRQAAIDYASLDTGVKRYQEIYQLLLGY
jgi:glycosyltransferase involved in cell wall biosynthesis